MHGRMQSMSKNCISSDQKWNFILHSNPFQFKSIYDKFLLWMYNRSKRTKHTYLFQYKLSYTIETCTNHHGLMSTPVWCFKIFLVVRLHGGSLPNFNFFNVNPQIFQRNRKIQLSYCLETNFHDIPNISWRDIRRRSYS